MSHRVTLIPGDGTGPEIAEATRRVIDATGVRIEWDVQDAGADVMDRFGGNPLPDHVLDSIRQNGVAIKGPITTPVGTGFRSVNVALRKELDMYAQVRPCKIYPGVRTRYADTPVDLVIVRENTEDLYAGIEFERGSLGAREVAAAIERASGAHIRDDAGISIKPISEFGTRRVVQFAFDYARAHGRKKVTSVHKANIMKHTDGLWLEVSREVAEKNTDIEFEDRIVDNMCMQLRAEARAVRRAGAAQPLRRHRLRPRRRPGRRPGGGARRELRHATPRCSSRPTARRPSTPGQNKVNPIAMMLSGVLMLQHLEERDAADRLEAAIAAVIAEGRNVTYDMKPPGRPTPRSAPLEVADAIIEQLGEVA